MQSLVCARNFCSKQRYPDLPKYHPLCQQRESNNAHMLMSSVTPLEKQRSHGILTVCPSDTAFAISLGPTNPWLIVIAKETLVFRRRGFSPLLWLLVPTFLLPHAPLWLTPSASTQSGILSYRAILTNQNNTLSFGTTLSPVYLRCKIS